MFAVNHLLCVTQESKMKRVFLLVLIAVIIAGCSTSNSTSEKKIVFTSILPQKFFVEAISKGRIDVKVLVGPGKSPATYEPTPQQMIMLGKAKVLFTIGVPFEKSFLPKVKSSLPSLDIVNTTQGIKRRHFKTGSHVKNEKVFDPHVWMSPVLAKQISLNIYNTLVSIDPQGKEEYTKGYNNLIKDLDALNNELETILKPMKGKHILVYHPAFGYFSDLYGFQQDAIETGGKKPSPSHIRNIITYAKKNNISVVFLQAAFPQSSAKAIAQAINGTAVTLNPLNPQYISNMKNIAVKMTEAHPGK
jgi:zinc transport system substrate-binding protein